MMSLIQEHVQPGIIDLAEHGSVEESATVILPLYVSGKHNSGLELWRALARAGSLKRKGAECCNQ